MQNDNLLQDAYDYGINSQKLSGSIDPATLLRIVFILEEMGQSDKAHAIMKNLEGFLENDITPYKDNAIADFLAGNYESAVRCCECIASRVPEKAEGVFSKIYFGVEKCYNNDATLDVLYFMHDREPNNMNTCYEIAKLELKNGEYGVALSYLKKAIELGIERNKTKSYLGLIAKKLLDAEEISLAEEAIDALEEIDDSSIVASGLRRRLSYDTGEHCWRVL